MQRRRFKNILSFPDRLDQEIERLRAEAEKLPLGACPFSHFGRPRREYNSPKSAIWSRHFHRSR